MRIACVGGGPGNLFFASLMKHGRPDDEVVIFDRNRRGDTFGFGVVFSDATIANLVAADDVLGARLEAQAEHWDRIEVRLKHERHFCGGNGMSAITRATLLDLLTEQAVGLGVDIRTEHQIDSLADVADYDLVVAGDGASSRIRRELAEFLKPESTQATAKFIWFGTTYRFDGLTFLFEENGDGVFAVHGYPISESAGTFIVETDETSWRRAGLDAFDVAQPPGPSDEASQDYLEHLFGSAIDGHKLLANNSRWSNFRTIRNQSWHHENIVLLGDAAHTAHFSVGSGTKMAMEDAAALAAAVVATPDQLPVALANYEASRRPGVEHIQNAAGPSLSWWEHFGRSYRALEPWQFTVHFMTRSINLERWRRRDPDFVANAEAEWRSSHGTDPLRSPYRAGGLNTTSRVAEVDRIASCVTFEGGQTLPLLALGVEGGETPWAWWADAPDNHDDVGSGATLLGVGSRPALVVVGSGSALARRLLAESIRFETGVPTGIVVDELDEDDATTLVLSARCDFVVLAPTGAGAEALGSQGS